MPLLRDFVVDPIIKKTFFAQFCGGSSEEELGPCVARLRRQGIGAILDYAAEPEESSGSSSPSPSSPSSNSAAASAGDSAEAEAAVAAAAAPPSLAVARTHEYGDEALCDSCAGHVLRAIEAAAAAFAAAEEAEEGDGGAEEASGAAFAAAAASSSPSSSPSSPSTSTSNSNQLPAGYAAVKLTALTDPRVLVKLSACLREIERLFEKFDADADGRVSRKEFESVYKETFTDGEDPGRLDELWRYLSRGGEGGKEERQRGFIDKRTWMRRVKLRDVPSIIPRCRSLGPLAAAAPTAEELGRLDNLMRRLRGLAAAAKEKNVRRGREGERERLTFFVFSFVLSFQLFSSPTFPALSLFSPLPLKKQVRLLIDAEYTTVQPAIDAAALELMREFNSGSSDTDGKVKTFPTVYNTTQCYLRGAREKLIGEIEAAVEKDFSWAGKIVRGAYLDSENRRAAEANKESPCWPSLEETHECYDACAKIAVEEGVFASGGEVLLATHNKRSVSWAVDLLSTLEKGEPKDGEVSSSRVSFGQLYGMR